MKALIRAADCYAPDFCNRGSRDIPAGAAINPETCSQSRLPPRQARAGPPAPERRSAGGWGPSAPARPLALVSKSRKEKSESQKEKSERTRLKPPSRSPKSIRGFGSPPGEALRRWRFENAEFLSSASPPLDRLTSGDSLLRESAVAGGRRWSQVEGEEDQNELQRRDKIAESHAGAWMLRLHSITRRSGRI